MKREFLETLQVAGQPLPEEVIDRILSEQARLQFDGELAAAITRAGGRNATAIAALMDMEALRQEQEPAAAIAQALEGLKKDCGYLFETPEAPPPYARGTGTQPSEAPRSPGSLAAALREKFERK